MKVNLKWDLVHFFLNQVRGHQVDLLELSPNVVRNTIHGV